MVRARGDLFLFRNSGQNAIRLTEHSSFAFLLCKGSVCGVLAWSRDVFSRKLACTQGSLLIWKFVLYRIVAKRPLDVVCSRARWLRSFVQSVSWDTATISFMIFFACILKIRYCRIYLLWVFCRDRNSLEILVLDLVTQTSVSHFVAESWFF